jgi:hypothetical protein
MAEENYCLTTSGTQILLVGLDSGDLCPVTETEDALYATSIAWQGDAIYVCGSGIGILRRISLRDGSEQYGNVLCEGVTTTRTACSPSVLLIGCAAAQRTPISLPRRGGQPRIYGRQLGLEADYERKHPGRRVARCRIGRCSRPERVRRWVSDAGESGRWIDGLALTTMASCREP